MMNSKINILIIESEPAKSANLEEKMKNLGFQSCFTVLPQKPIEQMGDLDPEAAILGPSLDIDACVKCIHKLKIIDASIPILSSCGELFIPEGSGCTPFDGIHNIGRGYESDELSKTLEEALKYKAENIGRPECPALIGRSQKMINIGQKIRTFSDKDINVLITGETGSGKELIARSIHFYSPRNEGPLVKISSGALPHELLESEVFGFQKGAFTGAHKTKPGRIELADGGTLFIDEIGALSLSLQAKFLQVLEERAFWRLGGIHDKVLDIRVVAATNSNLRQMVHEGTFRKDLFFRLNIGHIKVPPLRERQGDIPLITHYFLNKYSFELKRAVLEVPDHVTNWFLSYHWPGNVRELENAVRQAIVLKDWKFIFSELKLDNSTPEERPGAISTAEEPIVNWSEDKIQNFFKGPDFSLKKISKAYVSDAERSMILKALRETKWNRKKAAQLLGVSYKTLLNRIGELELKP